MLPAFEHQVIAREKLHLHDFYALLMEQGTGKSRPIVEDWLIRVADGRAQDLVVFGPKGCYMNWIGTEEEPGEIELWTPPAMRKDIHVMPWISGGSSTHRQGLQNFLHVKKPRFLAMNIEAFNRDGPAREYLHKFCSGRKVIGVVDESTTIAREDAARTKFFMYHNGYFVSRRILSGMVAPESPLDLFTQYWFLHPNIIGAKDFWNFKCRYAIMQKVDYRPRVKREEDEKAGKAHKKANVIVEWRNLEELRTKINRRSYRVTKDQVLDLPPKVFQYWDVDLTEEQERIYNQMKEKAFAQLEAGVFSTAKIKLDQLGKMQHILCGHVKQEDGETLYDIPENRTQAVISILHRHSGKAIIWAPYPQALRKIVDRLREEFGYDSTVGYWGETQLADRLAARARIQRDDLTRFIVSNQSVGKFGNTWTRCDMVIYYANSFDNEDRQQSEDRAHRIGQTKFVTYIDLRARGTLDERLIYVLRKKLRMSETLVGDEFKKWLE